MNKDHTWMNWKTFNCGKKPKYINGVKQFLKFAFANVVEYGKIRCPCVNCDNDSYQNKNASFAQ